MILVSFMNPYRARQRTTTLIVIACGLAPYIYCSAESKNRKRNDGLLSCFISGLYLLCSLSVGICLFNGEMLVRLIKAMEHSSYAFHPNNFSFKKVVSLYHIGPLATVRMV